MCCITEALVSFCSSHNLAVLGLARAEIWRIFVAFLTIPIRCQCLAIMSGESLASRGWVLNMTMNQMEDTKSYIQALETSVQESASSISTNKQN